MILDRKNIRVACEEGECTYALEMLESFTTNNNNIRDYEYAYKVGRVLANRYEFEKIRLTVLTTFTANLIEAPLSCELFSERMEGVYQFLPYSQWQTVLNEPNFVDHFNPHFIIILLHIEDALPLLAHQHLAREDKLDDERGIFFHALKQSVLNYRSRSNTPIVLGNFIAMERRIEKLFDWNVKNSKQRFLNNINHELASLAGDNNNLFLFDYSGMVSDFGRKNYYNAVKDAYNRTAVTQPGLIFLAKELTTFIRAISSPRKKVLVLDLDNTLWGGVAGEDGPNGIIIGGEHPGNSYKNFQSFLLNLRASGILLTIASKNNEDDILELFELRKDDLVLQLEDFSCYQIHWGDKPLSIESLAKELKLGTDSFVFVDDSAIECDLVKTFCADVEVITLEGDPSSFASKIMDTGFFDTVTLTADDAHRASLYVAETERKKFSEQITDKTDFLKRLQINLSIAPPHEAELERVVQLINKTNQFNLTTKRYNLVDVMNVIDSSSEEILVCKLTDKFGTYGLIGVQILAFREEDCFIDTFLLSCRALGRHIEASILAVLENRARESKATRLLGCYKPSAKNALVADFYSSNGFQAAQENGFFVKDLRSQPAMRVSSHITLVN